MAHPYNAETPPPPEPSLTADGLDRAKTRYKIDQTSGWVELGRSGEDHGHLQACHTSNGRS